MAIFSGTPRNDRLVGGPGDDRMFGRAGDDRLEGRAGRDELSGNAGDDTLFGNDGRDTLYGGEGADRLWGGDGDDFLRPNGPDVAFGGDGSDQFEASGHGAVLFGGSGNDAFSNTEEANGWTATGGAGADVFLAPGDDGVARDITVSDFEAGTDRLVVRTDRTDGGIGSLDLADHIARFDTSGDGKLSLDDGETQELADGDGYVFGDGALELRLDGLQITLVGTDTLF